MAELTTKARNALPASKFAIPEQRKYPVDTSGRAANAKSRAHQQYNRGALSAAAYHAVVGKANRVLGKTAAHR